MKNQGKEVLQPIFVALRSRYWMRCQHVIKPDEDIIVEDHGYDDEGPTLISVFEVCDQVRFKQVSSETKTSK